MFLSLFNYRYKSAAPLGLAVSLLSGWLNIEVVTGQRLVFAWMYTNYFDKSVLKSRQCVPSDRSWNSDWPEFADLFRLSSSPSPPIFVLTGVTILKMIYTSTSTCTCACINPFSEGCVFIRQNLTSVDVRF